MIPFVDLAKQQSMIKTDLDSRIAKVLAHGKFILGPEVQELEEKLAAYVGVKHCVTCANGTDALLIALMSLGIGKGDEVITTAFTYVATGEVIARVGAKPIFIDIEKNTYNIDPTKIESAINKKTKAIMPVSLYGQCADFDRINDIARKYNLPVIEDGAQSFGATYRGRRSCGLSTIGCTSFFPTKPLGCYGDGGAMFTNDDELAQQMVIIHKHGQDRRYHHIRMGLNSRLDTLQAAVLLAKLEKFDEEIKSRAEIGRKYTAALQNIDGVKVPFIADGNTSVYAQYTIRVENREALQAALKEKDIPTAVHYPIPLNRQPMFDYLTDFFDVPKAEEAAKHVVSLPMGAWMSDETIDTVVGAIREHMSIRKPVTFFNSSKQKRVLMIAYYFPPLSGSGVFRSIKFAKYLQSFGWHPTVVSTNPHPRMHLVDQTQIAEIPSDVDVIRIDDKTHEYYAAGLSQQKISNFLNFLFAVFNQNAEATKLFSEMIKIPPLLGAVLSTPSPGVPWAFDVFNYIDKNMNIRDFDIVYTTTGPYCAHLVGYHLHKKYEIPWIADYRDQWIDNPYFTYDIQKNPVHRLLWHTEDILLHNSTCNIATAEGIVGEYLDHFNLTNDKIISITNGYDEADFLQYPMMLKKTDKFTINFSGMLYMFRKIDPILQTLQTLCSEGLINKNELRFRIVDRFLPENIQTAQRYNLGSILDQTGYVSHQEALTYNVNSDLLLSLMGDDHRMQYSYSGKIFEQLRSGHPILAIAPSGGVIDQVLQETGHGKSFVSTQIDGIKQMILEEYRRWKQSDHTERFYSPKIRQFERKLLTGKLAALFDRVVAEK